MSGGTPPRALWVLETGKIIREEGGTAKFLNFCKSKNIKMIFLYSGKELFKKGEDRSAIKKFLREAHGAGMKVDALDGWPEAVYKENHEEFLSSLKNILEFNAEENPCERFDGFQSDVEPYNLSDYKESKEKRNEIEKLFIELHAECRKIAGKKFNLGLAISERYSHEESSVPAKMLESVDYLAVMAYRNKADRIINSSEYFINMASDMDKKIWVGVETGNPGDEPASISFYGKSEKKMEEELQKVSDRFAGEKGFAGIAIHSCKSYAKMDNSN